METSTKKDLLILGMVSLMSVVMIYLAFYSAIMR